MGITVGRNAIIWLMGAGLLTGFGGGLYAWSTGLSRAFDMRRTEAAAVPIAQLPVLTEEDLAPLPEPVRRYIALTGSVGRPVVTEIAMEFEATMYDAPGADGMTGRAKQYERFDAPHRLFLMSSRMKGLSPTVIFD
ncbi:DUF6544 family protein [Erythrobacter ani]|uniref:Uncharacterized protein n=1 Tax=Erythrobacter ani TaxID=2827235 RepID=A0ABS6SKC3_9SPHN|nr:DUF6544 family protein [Erythrobacter ani]MBV7265466.1 hypothetical protein [Erythrobacter ani]